MPDTADTTAAMKVTLEVTCHKCNATLSVNVTTNHYGFSSRIVTQELEIELDEKGWKTNHEPHEARTYACPKCKEAPEMEILITETELKDALALAIQEYSVAAWDEDRTEEKVEVFFSNIVGGECYYRQKEE